MSGGTGETTRSSGEWSGIVYGVVYVTAIPGGVFIFILALLNRQPALRRTAIGLAIVTLAWAMIINIAGRLYSAMRTRDLERQMQQYRR